MRSACWVPRIGGLAAGALAAGLIASCGEEVGPVQPAVLRLTSVTSGDDPDSDGYFYSLDGNPPALLAPAATVILAGLAPGTHTLLVTGVEDNCALQGGATRTFSLSAGDTTEVRLEVSCQALPVSHPAGIVAATVFLPGAPYGVAVNRSGTIYTALIGSDRLARGNLIAKSFSSHVTVGSTPPHVVFDPPGTTAYATLQTGRALAAVDVASNSVIGSLPLASDGFNLAVAPDGASVYVTTADGTLYVIEPATLAVDTTLFVGEAANGLAFSPAGNLVYVSSRDAGTVVAVERATHGIVRTFPVGGAPQRLAMAPDGTFLYVANESSGLDVIDLGTGIISQYTFGTAGYGVGVTPDGAQLYVLLPDAGEVRILGLPGLIPLQTLHVGGRPRNVVFSQDGRTALVANEQAVVFIE